jgi:hypothetical protein
LLAAEGRTASARPHTSQALAPSCLWQRPSAQADAIEIEALAKRRLADEYDTAQERGEVAKHGANLRKGPDVPKGNVGKATAADVGLSRKEIHEDQQSLQIPLTVRSTFRFSASILASLAPSEVVVGFPAPGMRVPLLAELAVPAEFVPGDVAVNEPCAKADAEPSAKNIANAIIGRFFHGKPPSGLNLTVMTSFLGVGNELPSLALIRAGFVALGCCIIRFGSSVSTPPSIGRKTFSADVARELRSRCDLRVEPELLAEIQYRAKSAEGKVRHPFFKGLREDL